MKIFLATEIRFNFLFSKQVKRRNNKIKSNIILAPCLLKRIKYIGKSGILTVNERCVNTFATEEHQ